MTETASVVERLNRYFSVQANGCWQWHGYKNQAGYGALSVRGKKREAYRVAYEEFIGEVPKGLDLDHLCRNRACINPGHLEPVTRGQNSLRGKSAVAENARKTHCKNGHEFTAENTYFGTTQYGRRRHCATCSRALSAAYLKRKKMLG